VVVDSTHLIVVERPWDDEIWRRIAGSDAARGFAFSRDQRPPAKTTAPNRAQGASILLLTSPAPIPPDAPVMIATFLASNAGSCDEVGLVGHASGPSAADADEDAFVQPVEIGGGGLDLRRGTEGLPAGVDLLAAAETCEYVGGAVSDTS